MASPLISRGGRSERGGECGLHQDDPLLRGAQAGRWPACRCAHRPVAGQGIAATILLRGTSVNLAQNLPLTAIAVDTRPVIETVLDRVLELASPGLVTLEQAVLLSDEIDPVGIASHVGEATKLCFFLDPGSRTHRPSGETPPVARRGTAGSTAAWHILPPG